MKFFALSLAVLSAVSCAVQPLPELPPSHPASPQATEARARPAATDLTSDEATRATGRLLAEPEGRSQ